MNPYSSGDQSFGLTQVPESGASVRFRSGVTRARYGHCCQGLGTVRGLFGQVADGWVLEVIFGPGEQIVHSCDLELVGQASASAATPASGASVPFTPFARGLHANLQSCSTHMLQGAAPSQQSTKMDARQRRLEEGPTLLLYHQTSEQNASEILRTGRMFRGKDGLAGGGIYFAATPRETHAKAHQKGVILEAQVQLGNVRQVQDQLPGATFRGLQNEGFDSVCILKRQSGHEYVVYNFDQVAHIERFIAP